MAGLTTNAGKPHRIGTLLGRLITLTALILAVILGKKVLNQLDNRPSTHDAFLYADSAGLAPEVSGTIEVIHIRENQQVHKGEKLLEIDPEPFRLRVKQTRAQIEALHAQIGLTKRQVSAQTTGAEAASILITRARTQLALAHDTLERLLPLQQKGFITDQKIDEARTNEKTAQDALASAILQARQAKESVGDIESLLAQLNGAEASLALAERDLRNTTLVAPFDGYVTGFNLAKGAYAAAGHPLFTLIQAQPWYAIGNFRETELPQITQGQTAFVWLMSDNQHPISAHVESLGLGVRPDSGGVSNPGLPTVGRTLNWVVVAQRFPVRLRLDNPPPAAMRIGATVTIRLNHDGNP